MLDLECMKGCVSTVHRAHFVIFMQFLWTNWPENEFGLQTLWLIRVLSEKQASNLLSNCEVTKLSLNNLIPLRFQIGHFQDFWFCFKALTKEKRREDTLIKYLLQQVHGLLEREASVGKELGVLKGALFF